MFIGDYICVFIITGAKNFEMSVFFSSYFILALLDLFFFFIEMDFFLILFRYYQYIEESNYKK